MTFLLALSFVLGLVPNVGYAPVDLIATVRFSEPVFGEVCVELQSTTDESELFYRSSCEDLNGRIKTIRLRGIPAGEYSIRATFKGGADRLVSQPQPLVVKATH